MDWSTLLSYKEALLAGLWMTVQISFCTMLLSLVIGVLIGCGRVFPNFYIIRFSGLYADVMRNIPAVVKVFIAYFVFKLDAFTAGVVALSLHQSSYISDVVVSGIRSIPLGQVEAALSTGLSTQQAFVRILLPQAFRVSIPPLTTQFIQVIKNSSTVMLIAVEELTFVTRRIENETFRGVEAAIAVTAIYVGLALGISLVMSIIQQRSGRRV